MFELSVLMKIYTISMKIFFSFLLITSTSYAQFSKPKLLARYGSLDGWNAKASMACFSSEPAVTSTLIFLGCQDEEGAMMVGWDRGKFHIVKRAAPGELVSHPVATYQHVSWSEFTEETVTRSIVYRPNVGLMEKDLREIAPISDYLPLGNDQWLYKNKRRPSLWVNGDVKLPLFTQEVSYIFSPIVGANGELVIKARRSHLGEDAPDELWVYQDGFWKMILNDSESDPSSKWLSFRHGMSVDGNKVAVIAKDNIGDVLLLIENGLVNDVARLGDEIASFDYFSLKMRAGTLVFRGTTSEGRKAIWVYAEGKLKRLITQGDPVYTDRGLAQVNYPNEHSIFWGSPGIGPRGEVVIQATLVDDEHLNTLLGIGLILFDKQ